MKKLNLLLAGVVAFGAAFAGASYDAGTSTLTLDGVMTNVTTEADLDPAAKIVFANGGGVAFAETLKPTKTYSIAGSGLDATGVVSVAAGKTVSFQSKGLLQTGILGHTFVKRGAGTLYLHEAFGAIATPTRMIVEEGSLEHNGGDLFGNHSGTTLNGVIDVREGAQYAYANGVGHSPMGPLELTGGTFRAPTVRPATEFWGNTAFKGGVVAHACATPSVIYLASWAHLGHCQYSNIVFDVETGAKLIVDGVLTNGYTSAEQPSSLIKRGGGELVLLRHGGWTGGTVIEDGTVTVAHPTALGAREVKLAGDATLNVQPGMTLRCGALTGSGTLTKTGAGGVTFASVADGVTVVRADGEGTLPTALVDGVLHLGGGMAEIDVPAGETGTVSSIVVEDLGYDGLARDIQMTGTGTLVLPNADNGNIFRNLYVQGGTVQVATENNLGSGSLVLSDGAVLTGPESISFSSRRILVKGAGTVDVPEGKTFTVATNTLFVAGATLTKLGAGTLSFSQSNYQANGYVNDATRFVVEEGTLQINQDPFGGHSVASKTTVECHEGTTLYATGHTPLGHVVLRGATMKISTANRNALGAVSGKTALETDTIGKWNGFSLNGTIEVLPAAGGLESAIDAARCYLAHANNQTVFDVKDGAVLRVKARLRDGFDASANIVNPSGFTKLGGGELILDRTVDTTGVIHLEQGTLTLGQEGAIPDVAQLDVTPGATLRLADGAVTGVGAATIDPFLATADVWFDATRLAAANGASVATAPNLGMSGGSFKKANASAPTYKTNAINGLSAIHCDGGMALVLDSYTNYTANITVFMVAQWTSWDDNNGVGGKGRWGGGLSMSYYAATGNDNETSYSYHTETSGNIGNTSSSAPGISQFTIANPNRVVGSPYLDMIAYVTNRADFVQYVGDGVADMAGGQAKDASIKFKIDRVALGGRMRGAGQVQYGGSATDASNRMYIGDIGEVLVFTRVLTAAEHATVAAYLKRKWFNSSATCGDGVANAGAGLNIDVPEGTGGFAGTVASDSANPGSAVLDKTGAGTLALRANLANATGQVTLDEGALALSGEAIASRADVWMDAADASTLTFDAQDKVSAVRNKGRAGGSFGQCPGRYSTSVPYPTYLAAAINGNGALVFNTDAGLQLTSYTNATSPRSVHMYAVMQGHGGDLTTGGKGKWGGPFSLYDARQTGDDQTTTGSFQITETLNGDGVNQSSKYMGMTSRGDVLPANGLQEPYLFVAHQDDYGAVFAYEWADTDPAAVTAYAMESRDAMSSTCVNLGGRSTDAGALQWQSLGHANNRTWSGYFGELVIVTRKLSCAEEAALLAYLRKKWLAKGDGSATAPAFLSGAYGAPALAGTGLACADGTAVAVDGAPVALASLTTAGTVDWLRVWDGVDAANAALFTVAGDVSLGAVNLDVVPKPKTEMPVLGWGGAALTDPTWTVTSEGAETGARVSARSSAYWLSAGGMVIYVR